eukprot:UN29028
MGMKYDPQNTAGMNVNHYDFAVILQYHCEEYKLALDYYESSKPTVKKEQFVINLAICFEKIDYIELSQCFYDRAITIAERCQKTKLHNNSILSKVETEKLNIYNNILSKFGNRIKPREDEIPFKEKLFMYNNSVIKRNKPIYHYKFACLYMKYNQHKEAQYQYELAIKYK